MLKNFDNFYLLNDLDHTHDFLIALFVSLLMNVISRLPKINIKWFSLTKWS